MARFQIKIEEGLYYLSTKTKALISFVVAAELICAFVFAYAKSRFSHNEAHIVYKNPGVLRCRWVKAPGVYCPVGVSLINYTDFEKFCYGQNF